MAQGINRRAALELSISTIVVIVIGMSMLVLGLVLVRTIFTGSTKSIDSLNDQVQKSILNLFNDNSGNLVVSLGSAETAKVKPGDRFNVGIGAQNPSGAPAPRGTLKYKITLSEDSDNNCLRVLGRQATEGLFVTRLNTPNDFDTIDGSNNFALIETNIPKGTATCTQKVNVDLFVTGQTTSSDGDSFILEVTKPGLFG